MAGGYVEPLRGGVAHFSSDPVGSLSDWLEPFLIIKCPHRFNDLALTVFGLVTRNSLLTSTCKIDLRN
jgi:hypothetical protein